MKNILAVSHYTLKEALSKKVFITFLIISSVILLGFLLFLGFTSFDSMSMSVKGKGLPPDEVVTAIVHGLQISLIIPLYGLGLFLSIFSTAGFIPNLLEKGNIDLFLSKPISRSQLLTGKFFGVLGIVFVNIAYLILGVWVMLGFKFGVWNSGFLVTIISIVFTFASLYGLSALVSVLTKSSALSMILAYIIYIILSPLLAIREKLFEMMGDATVVKALLNGLYYLLPKTHELGNITQNLALGLPINDYQPIISTFLFTILTFSISLFIFSKKDY